MTPLPAPESLVDYLWHWETCSPQRIFLSDDTGDRLDYASAAAEVRSLSVELWRNGVGFGGHVAVLAENSAGWVVAFLAAQAMRAVAVPLPTRLTAADLDTLLSHAQPAALVVDEACAPLVNEAWRDRVVRLDDPRSPLDRHGRVVPTVATAPACVTYTSGTTGRPKGVVLSNQALVHAAQTYASLFHSTPAMHTIAAVPLCHNTGFIDQVAHALIAGGSMHAQRRFRADAVADALTTGGCTFFIGVPTMYHRIVDHLDGVLPNHQAPSLAFGGAPMPSQLIDRLHAIFPNAQLANCYGLSEATSITHINFVRGSGSATAVGVAVPGTVDRISLMGELLVRSPTTMLGYLHDPAATAAKFEEGWLRTGDLASRDDDGMVHVFGRVDDVINRGGEKVAPLEVEEALCAHPSIAEAAVVGLPDDEYGSVVAAAVVTTGPISLDDVGRFVARVLADYKRPVHIITVDELPRNDNGKVVRADVRERVSAALIEQDHRR